MNKKSAHSRRFTDGETRTRTGDTTIFSRVLYQLSYLAATADGTGNRAAFARATAGRYGCRSATYTCPSSASATMPTPPSGRG